MYKLIVIILLVAHIRIKRGSAFDYDVVVDFIPTGKSIISIR